MSLDEQCWMENREIVRLGQKNWIPKYNETGRIMAAVPDYYNAGKEGDDSLLSGLHIDFQKSWIITGTRFEYNTESLESESKIIHYPESTVVVPIERNVSIPDYSNGVFLPEVLGTNDGLAYFQALCLTEDDGETIMQTLERLGDKKRDEIKVWTPSLSSRKNLSGRAASLLYGSGRFHIGGNYSLDDDGRSRGVSASIASDEARSAERAKKLRLPFGIESDIDKKTKSVTFSNMQTIGNFNKYTAMVAFHEKRYVLSAIFDIGEVPNLNERVAEILSQKEMTAEKLTAIGNFLHPVYAHLSLYSNGEEIDDVEWFEDLKK